MRQLAIDPSCSRMGICSHEGMTNSLVPPKGCTGIERLAWFRQVLRAEIAQLGRGGLLFLEDYSFGSKGAGVIQLAELGGMIRLLFRDFGCGVVLVSPSVLKKWATGKGNSSKDEVQASATLLAGRPFANNDEADAWVLGAIGAQLRGEPWTPVTAEKKSCLKGLSWAVVA